MHLCASSVQTLSLFEEILNFDMHYDKLSTKAIEHQLHADSTIKAYDLIFVANLLSDEKSFIYDIENSTSCYNDSFDFNFNLGVYVFFNVINQHSERYILLICNNKKMIFNDSTISAFLTKLMHLQKEHIFCITDTDIIKIIKTFKSYDLYTSLHYITTEFGNLQLFVN